MHKRRVRKLHMLCGEMDAMHNKKVRRERRRQKLHHLVAEIALERGGDDRGAQKTLADLVETEQSHMSAMMSGTRGIGVELQARFEQVRNKPPGWFDLPDSVVF